MVNYKAALISEEGAISRWCNSKFSSVCRIDTVAPAVFRNKYQQILGYDAVLVNCEENLSSTTFTILQTIRTKIKPAVFPIFYSEDANYFAVASKFENLYPLFVFNENDNGLSEIQTHAMEQKLINKQMELGYSGSEKDNSANIINGQRNFKEYIQAAADSDVNVLLLGESGAGKGFTAKAIHINSKRKTKPFQIINLSETNQNLIESMLFGTVKGAYTGAEDKMGLLEAANGGTVFIDEIGQLSLDMQNKFFNLLDTHKCRRIGSTEDIPLDVRFIFATDANIHTLIEKDLFKRQLYFRMEELKIEIPALRDHKKDIPNLAAEFAAEYGKTINNSGYDKLISFNWPGNIRQLHNCIKRASSICGSGDVITADEIELY